MQNIIIQLLFALGLYYEAMHDKAVILLQNYQHPDYLKLSADWHKYNSYQYGLICIAAAYICGWWMLPCLLLQRASIFPLSLNILRKKESAFYLSDKGFDLTMKKILGKYAGHILIISSFALIILLNILK